MACWLPGEGLRPVSSTLLTRKGEPVTNQAGPTAIDDAALIIEDEAVAWTGPAPTAPPACLPGWLADWLADCVPAAPNWRICASLQRRYLCKNEQIFGVRRARHTGDEDD